MLWISFGKWSSKATSMFVWDRVYRKGYIWTPFVMASIRYPIFKPKVSTEMPVGIDGPNGLEMGTEDKVLLGDK